MVKFDTISLIKIIEQIHMLRNSVVVGLDHKKAPLDVRERFKKISLPMLSSKLPQYNEIMVLSTCNRFEVYGSTVLKNSHDDLMDLLAKEVNLHPKMLEGLVYRREGAEMVRHGFRVVSSLESMVLGEPQILGQMKQAYLHAKDAGKVGSLMDKFCSSALRVGKRVRTETGLGKSATSIASQAVSLIAKNIPEKSTVLVVGAGDMIKSALTHLKRYPNLQVVLCNRTFANAKALAAKYSGVQVVCYEGLDAHLHKCSAVLTSTASADPIFTKEKMEKIAQNRTSELLMVDIAVPRDIEKAVEEVNGINVFDIDQLGAVVEENISARQNQVHIVHDIIEEELESFINWSDERKNVHMIDHMRSYMEMLRQDVLEQNSNADAEEATRLLLNKIMHHPSVVLKSGQIPSEAMENALELMFGVSCPRVRLLPIRGKSAKTSSCPVVGLKTNDE